MKAIKLLNILLASALLASLFLVNATTVSQTIEYDPWIDFNDDGEINLYDAVMLLTRYGSSGTPINKTELLLELLAKLDYLNAEN